MKLPPPKRRPKLAQWRYDRNLTLRATADLLEQTAGYRVCSHETVRVLCLPFDDPDRVEPEPDLALAIATLTGGEVRPDDFVPPEKEAA